MDDRFITPESFKKDLRHTELETQAGKHLIGIAGCLLNCAICAMGVRKGRGPPMFWETLVGLNACVIPIFGFRYLWTAMDAADEFHARPNLFKPWRFRTRGN